MSKILIDEAVVRRALEALSKSDDFLFDWHENESDNEADAYATARHLNEKAITALRESLAEQPAQQEPSRYQELREVLENLMSWQVKNVDKWHNGAYDQASEVLERHDATPQAQPAQQEPVFSFQMELHAPAGALIHPYPHVVGTPDFKSLFGKVGDRVTFYTSPPAQPAEQKEPVAWECDVLQIDGTWKKEIGYVEPPEDGVNYAIKNKRALAYCAIPGQPAQAFLASAQIVSLNDMQGVVDWLPHNGAPLKAGDYLYTSPQPAQQEPAWRTPGGIPRFKPQPAPMIRGDIRDGLVDDEPAQQESVATDWERIAAAIRKGDQE